MARPCKRGLGRRLLAAGWLVAGILATGLLGRWLSVHRGTPGFAPAGLGLQGVSTVASADPAGAHCTASVIAASFRRVSEQDTGTIRLRLRNPTGRTLRASSWRVNGAPLDLIGLMGDRASHRDNLELIGDARPDASPVSPASLDKHELYSPGNCAAAVWAWGAAARGLPPGESDLVLKLPRPPQGPVRVEGTFDDGRITRVDVAPITPELAISYVATDVDRQQMYVYVDNRGPAHLHPVQCWLDGTDVTADCTFASRAVEPGGKGCWVIHLRRRPTPGEARRVRLVTAEGVEARATAKVFGRLVLAPSEFALGDGLHVLSVCPSHAYGSLGNAATTMLRDRAEREDRGDRGLFGLQVCSGGKGPVAGRDRQFRFGYDVRSLFVFAETGDFLVLNPLVDWPFCGRWSEEYGTVVSWRTAMARRAVEPGPVFTLLLDKNFGQPGELRRPFSADELRYLAYCELAGGSKGLVQRQDGPPPVDAGARDQVFRELAPVQRLIALGDGAGGATVDHPDFEAKAIWAGPDGMAVILLNQAHDPGWAVRDHPVAWRLPRRPVTVAVRVPDGLRVDEVVDARTDARLPLERTNDGIRFSTAAQTPASCFILRPTDIGGGAPESHAPISGDNEDHAGARRLVPAPPQPVEALPRVAGFGLVTRRPVPGTQRLVKQVELVNYGTRALAIARVGSSSAAVSCEPKVRDVPPGARVPLTVAIDVSRLSGRWLEALTIEFAEGDAVAPLEIPVAGVTLPGVVWEPRQLCISVDAGRPATSDSARAEKQVRIWNPDSLDFAVRGIALQPSNDLRAALGRGTSLAPSPWTTTLCLGRGAALLRPGDYDGVLHVETNDPQCPTVEVPYQLAVWR